MPGPSCAECHSKEIIEVFEGEGGSLLGDGMECIVAWASQKSKPSWHIFCPRQRFELPSIFKCTGHCIVSQVGCRQKNAGSVAGSWLRRAA
jgi:hypothetical protein